MHVNVCDIIYHIVERRSEIHHGRLQCIELRKKKRNVLISCIYSSITYTQDYSEQLWFPLNEIHACEFAGRATDPLQEVVGGFAVHELGVVFTHALKTRCQHMLARV